MPPPIDRSSVEHIDTSRLKITTGAILGRLSLPSRRISRATVLADAGWRGIIIRS
jgi:hypothetical protein